MIHNRKSAIAVYSFPESDGTHEIAFTLGPGIELRVTRVIWHLVNSLQKSIAFPYCRPTGVMSRIFIPVNAVVVMVVRIPGSIGLIP